MANLFKSLTHGLLAVASVGAILTLSESAKAFTFTVSQAKVNGFTQTLNDKIFSNFSFSGSTIEDQDEITVIVAPGGTYELNYSAAPGTKVLTTNGSLSYKVTISPSYSNVFAGAGTNAQGSAGVGETFSKSITETNLNPSPLVFVSTGGPVNGNFNNSPKVINVTSSWVLNSQNSFINGFSDQYTQNPVNPDPVPEPLTILGTGVVLGALPTLKKEYAKRNKKKKGNA